MFLAMLLDGSDLRIPYLMIIDWGSPPVYVSKRSVGRPCAPMSAPVISMLLGGFEGAIIGRGAPNQTHNLPRPLLPIFNQLCYVRNDSRRGSLSWRGHSSSLFGTASSEAVHPCPMGSSLDSTCSPARRTNFLPGHISFHTRGPSLSADPVHFFSSTLYSLFVMLGLPMVTSLV
jgi:hypothetical protein